MGKGLRHHLHEMRQKIKFNKDLWTYNIKWNRIKKEICDLYNPTEDIPKVIHCIWFGRNPYPEDVQQCMKTWEEKLKGYEIKVWNEDTFPIHQYKYVEDALEQKKWAFAADLARLHVLYTEGGIYLDTDMKVIKNFDNLLSQDLFFSYESPNLISMGVVGGKKGHPWFKFVLDWYSHINCDADYTEIANTRIVAKLSRLHYGIKLRGQEQVFGQGIHLYPREYFNPEFINEEFKVTANTYAIHLGTGLWL